MFFSYEIEKRETKRNFDILTFDPTKIFIDWAHQNDPQNLIFVKAINVVVKKMARNGRTMANSYHCGLFARPVFS